jgi:parallel beta-helix repeat protein
VLPVNIVDAQTPPPQAGDWIIEDTTVIENETIILRGNLIVGDGGNLTLRNCEVYVHNDFPGQRGIEVEDEGVMWAYGTTFTTNVPGMNYNFRVYGLVHIERCDLSGMLEVGIYLGGNAIGKILDSDVHDNGLYRNVGITADGNSVVEITGNNIYNHLLDLPLRGVGIYSRRDSIVKISGNNISNNNGGIGTRENSIVTIQDNTITFNDYGIITWDNSVVTVVGNNISDNSVDAIETQDNSSVIIQNNIIKTNGVNGIISAQYSQITVVGNDISHNGDRGVDVQGNSSATIENNTINSNIEYGIINLHYSRATIMGNFISDTKKDGIAVTRGASPLIINCTIINSSQFGISVWDISKPKIYNCTISNSGKADIYAGNNSHPTVISTFFDRDKVYFNDTVSDISVGWWVRGEVLDEANNPVKDAAVKILDSEGDIVFEGNTNDYGRTGLVPVIEATMSNNGIKSLTPHNFTAVKGNTSGFVIREVTRNLNVQIRLGIHDYIPLPDWIDPGELFIRFESPETGSFLRGTVTLTVSCCRFLDCALFYLEDDGEQVLIGNGSMLKKGLDLEYTFDLDTANYANGEYLLVVEGQNTTFDFTARNNVKVYIDNERSSLGATVASAGIAVIAAVGAAFAVGSGAAEEIVSEYAEERIYDATKQRALPGAVQGMLAIVSALVLAGSFTYLYLEDYSNMLMLFAYMLISTGTVIIFMEGVEVISAKRNNVESGFSLWPVGLLSLLATTFFIKLPFGSPGKTKVMEGADVKGAGISGLAMLLAAPVLLPIFVLLLHNGYYDIGLIGGYTIVMLFFVDSLPIKPLEGKRVFQWNKGVWLGTFCFSAFLLFAWQQVWIGYDVFLMLGVVALVAVIIVLSRKTTGPRPSS